MKERTNSRQTSSSKSKRTKGGENSPPFVFSLPHILAVLFLHIILLNNSHGIIQDLDPRL